MSRLVITKKQRRSIVSVAVVLLLGTVVAVGSLGGDSTTSSRGELPVESFELFSGGEATFADFGDKPLVINFWASWCPACVAELPEFQSASEQYGEELVFLGLANSDQRNASIALASDVGLTYTLGDDPKGDLFRSLGLIAMPSTIFVTADGEILEIFGGQLNERALTERIDELVAAS